MTITFSPKEIGELETIVYLDIDGVADRLPLKLLGISLPPTIHLNVETLNMDYVYINKKYNYEIVAINRGNQFYTFFGYGYALRYTTELSVNLP